MSYREQDEYWHCPVCEVIIYQTDRKDSYCGDECHDTHHDETKQEVLAKVSREFWLSPNLLDLECEEVSWNFEESTWRVWRCDLDAKDEGGYWLVTTWPEKIEFVSVVKSTEEVS